MRQKLYFLFIGIILSTGLKQQAAAKTYDFGEGRKLIGKYLEILYDTAGTLSANEVYHSSGFQPLKQDIPNLDFNPAVIWLKFTVQNTSPARSLMLEIENPLLEETELYEQNGDSVSFTGKAGTAYPYRDRLFKATDFIYELHVPTNTARTYLIRLRSNEQIILPMFISSKESTTEILNQRGLVYGIHIGILLVMILYNLFLFISVKDKSYLYYVFYILFIGLTQITLTGYTFKFFFADTPFLFNKSIVIFPALAGISALMFIRSFLHTDVQLPRASRLLWIWVVLYASAAVMRIAGKDEISSRLIDITALSASVMVFYISIRLTIRGYRPAIFFLVAWTIFMLGLLLFVFRNLGILPYSLLTNYTMHAGTALEVTLLSIALADKINILNREKKESQEKALQAAQENERIVREQNIMLDQKVQERTHELQLTNKDLAQAIGDLKEAQSQLVEQEKMASLGQLTAGIAHEINNPINFVTSNVRPLRRDMDMLLDMMGRMEAIGLDGMNPEEKQKAMKQLREEFDYDYLQEEIHILLNGIQEGSNRTAEIVKGLRIFSRLDEDDLKKADMNEGLDSTTIIVNNLLNSRIEVVKNYSGLPQIECYPGKLNQVFLNIITNAIHAVKAKFGETSGGKITLSTHADEKNVYVTIADNGTGMDNATKAKIFEPFFTTKEVGEGTGLGLSIAYNTIKKHNGNILLETKPDEGTAFTLQLPIIHELQMS